MRDPSDPVADALREAAEEIAVDPRYGPRARLLTASILEVRADDIAVSIRAALSSNRQETQ